MPGGMIAAASPIMRLIAIWAWQNGPTKKFPVMYPSAIKDKVEKPSWEGCIAKGLSLATNGRSASEKRRKRARGESRVRDNPRKRRERKVRD